MAYIYRIWNDINDKSYIGKTIYSVAERWNQHKKDRKRRRCEKRPLYAAMNKYGVEHFHIETIEECSIETLNEREMYWVVYYDAYENGYNATRGGDGKCYVDSQEILDLWEQGKNCKEIANITGYCTETVSAHLKGNGISPQEILDRPRLQASKAVAKIDKITGEIIQTYINANEVERELNKTMASRHIYEVCRGQRKTAYGYRWKYVADLENE